jgi:hypothetical protein
MKQVTFFIVGHQDALDILGWHLALLIAFLSGYSVSHFFGWGRHK